MIPVDRLRNKNKTWSAGDDASLLSLRNERGMPYEFIGQFLGRTPAACQHRYSRLTRATAPEVLEGFHAEGFRQRMAVAGYGSLTQLAQASRIPESVLKMFVSGKKAPYIEATHEGGDAPAERLAAALGCTVTDLTRMPPAEQKPAEPSDAEGLKAAVAALRLEVAQIGGLMVELRNAWI